MKELVVECQSVWFSWAFLYWGEKTSEVQYVLKVRASETTMCREHTQSNSEGAQGEDGCGRCRTRGVRCSGRVGNKCRPHPTPMPCCACAISNAAMDETRRPPNNDCKLEPLSFLATRDSFDSGVSPFHQWCNRHKAEKQRRRRVGGVMLASLARQVRANEV